jgi:GH15 family glucan-1,4-alpha-glucosidase
MRQTTTISPETWREIEQLASYSKNLINNLQHETGAYPACPTFSAYRGFSWLRDGAFIADAMSASGVPDSAERFFDWCSLVMLHLSSAINTHHESFVNHTGFDLASALPTRFEFERAPAPDEPWPDHQIDGYGTWLWALQQHMLRFPTVKNRWQESIELSSKYLVASWDSACYDWWEEHPDRVHTSTLGAVQAGLKAALAMGELRSEIHRQVLNAVDRIDHELLKYSVAGFLPKWQGSEQVDSSALSLLAPFGLIDPSNPVFLETVSKVKNELLHGFGLHRYGSDSFFGGGLWPLLSCYLALAELKAGSRQFAEGVLTWVASLADDAGNLPEQVDDHLLEPTRQVYWVKRWGPSARPLLWTHAMFLKLKTEIERDK